MNDYDYYKERDNVFTPRGFEVLDEIKHKARDLIDRSGAIQAKAVISGDDPLELAALHFLTETGILLEVRWSSWRAKERIFIAGPCYNGPDPFRRQGGSYFSEWRSSAYRTSPGRKIQLTEKQYEAFSQGEGITLQKDCQSACLRQERVEKGSWEGKD